MCCSWRSSQCQFRAADKALSIPARCEALPRKTVGLDFSRPENQLTMPILKRSEIVCTRIDNKRLDYNERPHSSIGNKTPNEFMKSIGATPHPG